jgi:hypothetical protein
VVRVLGYRSGGRFDSRHYKIFWKKKEKENQWVWNGVHSASGVQLRSYLIEK